MLRTWSHEPDTVAKLEGRWKRGVHSVAKRRGDLVTSHARGPILSLCPANLFDSRFRLRRPASLPPCLPASRSGFKVFTGRLATDASAWRLNLDRRPPCLVRLLKEASAALEHGDSEPNNFMRCYLCADGKEISCATIYPSQPGEQVRTEQHIKVREPQLHL